VPGKLVSIEAEDSIFRRGKVSFGGVMREVNLAYVPEAVIGEYVIVHAGFALQRLDEEAAGRVFTALKELDALEDSSGGPI